MTENNIDSELNLFVSTLGQMSEVAHILRFIKKLNRNSNYGLLSNFKN